ncbi:MAG: outer membrane beta-barrel protein [Alphaproteobacteria bacterium]|nr:outer membrane beta-barrel protein [Alphaproteobacteria bacterium]
MEVSVQSLTLNGYYDFHNASKFTPYIGLGFGMAKVKYNYSSAYDIYVSGSYYESDIDKYRTSKKKFAYNISVGASYDI